MNYLSSESQVSYLGKDSLSNIEVMYPFPPIEKQNEIVERYEKLERIKCSILEKLNEIKSISSGELQLKQYKTMTVSEIALLNKGSNKISEKMIYENYDPNGIPIYSSATENNGLMGRITKECYDKFDKKGHPNELTWTTNGYAGMVFYRDTNYLYSEKCGRIVIREHYNGEILPEYLCTILNQITYKYKTSESNNGKLDIIRMEKIPIIIPVDNNGHINVDKQKNIIKLYKKINDFNNSLQKILDEISLLKSKV